MLEQILVEEEEHLNAIQQSKEYYDSSLGISKVNLSSQNETKDDIAYVSSVKFLLDQVYDQIHQNFTFDGGYMNSADYRHKE